MTNHQLIPNEGMLVAIDVAKARSEVLIEVPGSGRRRRLAVLNARADHDRLVTLLGNLAGASDTSMPLCFECHL